MVMSTALARDDIIFIHEEIFYKTDLDTGQLALKALTVHSSQQMHTYRL